MAAYETAQSIIADSAVELSLVSYADKPADVFADQNPNIGMLCQLLKSVGRDLVRCRQWTGLQRTWAFTTTQGVPSYALPNDFDRVIDQTAWNRTNRLPLGGPVSPQVYEFLTSRLQGITWNMLWRVLQGNFHAYPDGTSTPGSYNLAFEYISSYWVTPVSLDVPVNGVSAWFPGTSYSTSDIVYSGGNRYSCTAGGISGTRNPSGTTTSNDGVLAWAYVSVGGASEAVANYDTILLDPQLVRAALKLAYKETRGLDTAAAAADYNRSLERAINADTVAPVLNFGRHAFAEPLLGPWNLPINGTSGQ